MAEWAGIRALVLDLDGTLYDSPALMAEYPRRAVEFIAARLRIPREEAARRYERACAAMAAGGEACPSTTRVLVALTGAGLDEWAEFLASRVDPARFLDPADYGWLRNLLPRLHRYYRLGIVSNNNRLLAGRILDLLGVRGCFDAILTTSESGRTKPDPTLYLEIAAQLGVPPEACLSVGDRLAVDVIPAEEAGLRGALVSGPRELRALGEQLLAAAEAGEAGVRIAVGGLGQF